MDNVGVGFVVASYVATFVVLVGYTWSLWARLRRARKALTATSKR